MYGCENQFCINQDGEKKKHKGTVEVDKLSNIRGIRRSDRVKIEDMRRIYSVNVSTERCR